MACLYSRERGSVKLALAPIFSKAYDARMMFYRMCLSTLALAGLLPAAAVADGSGLRLVYDMGGVPLTITRDAHDTYQFDGLPVPGMVLYTPATGTVYYQHPALPYWLKIGQDNLASALVKPNIAMGAAWQPYLDAPTRRYEVVTGNTTCDNWFGSQKAASLAGLNIADMALVIAATQYLNAGNAADTCEMLDVPARMGETVGLPLRMNGPNGLWELMTLEHSSVAHIPLPDAPQPLDADARLSLLMSQLGETERKDFTTQYGQLPVEQQIEELQSLLGATYSP